ncbi:triple tyrosine motif-containing protein [Pustulibacterium marinum]|uniref:triple tyrosine motif-containing protein n=1 Tax=Pustulibacterium marinum TaxID=1224947 RepID=UPI0015A5D62C|nr:triple tyrosine motif-containing protein [Pustulibacterium marinum]
MKRCFEILFVLLSCVAFGQENPENIPVLEKLSQQPNVKHFTRDDFNSDSQFWIACEDSDGTTFFGNNDGILIYNGTTWSMINLPNYSSVRSLMIGDDGTIYAGGYNEFGTVTVDEFGAYHYHSLVKESGLENVNFENVWQISKVKDYMVFRTFERLFIYKNKRLTQIPATTSFLKSYVINEEFYVEDANEGIFQLDLDQHYLKKVFDAEVYDNEFIIGITNFSNGDFGLLANNGHVFRVQRDSGISSQQVNISSKEKEYRIISFLQLKPDTYLLGTLRSGLLTFRWNSKGYTIEKTAHLQDETVLGLLQSKEGNVWALLDNGIDNIDYNNPKTTIFNQASVYDVLVEKAHLYVATNQGVYVADLSSQNRVGPESFQLINNTQGQAWSIQKVNNTILAGHDKGIFKIEQKEATKVGYQNSFWKVIPIPGKANLFLGCSYTGLFVVSENHGNWEVKEKIKGFNESSRDILAGDEPYTYWVCHGYKGVYKLTLNESLDRVVAIDHFTDQNGLKSPYNINVFRWKGNIVFTTNNGIYQYHKKENKFEPYQELNSILDKDKNTRKLVSDSSKTWAVVDDALGYFDHESEHPEFVKDIFLETKGTFNRGMETIVPINDANVLVGTHTGLYLYHTNTQNRAQNIPTKLVSVKYTADEEAFSLPLVQDSLITLPNSATSVRFNFAAPKIPNNALNTYSYKLEDVDKTWSTWQKMPFKEYNLLPAGLYTFHVKARNTLGIETTPVTYKFSIAPKWYQTNFALVCYVVFGLLSLFIAVKLVERKIEKQHLQAQEREQETNRLLQLEVKQLKLERDKERIEMAKRHLEEDVLKKSKELANYTMLLVSKKNFFNELQEELKELRNIVKTKTSNKKLTEIFHKLHQHKIDEEYMKVFEDNFENIHENFFTALKQQSTELTKREKRLSAFIKMGLTNKEIAPLLNISTRGVETARYRLRKKLELPTEESLSKFLEELAPED